MLLCVLTGQRRVATIKCRFAQSLHSRPRRLAWPRTSPFHGGNAGSNPVGDANHLIYSQRLSIRVRRRTPQKHIRCTFYRRSLVLRNDVRIPRQHSHVGVTELLLYNAPVRPSLHQCGAQAMSESMECPAWNPQPLADRVQDVPTHVATGDGLTLRVCEQQPERIGPPPGPVFLQHVHQHRWQRQITNASFRLHREQLPAPVALTHHQNATAQVYVLPCNAHSLTRTHAQVGHERETDTPRLWGCVDDSLGFVGNKEPLWLLQFLNRQPQLPPIE